MARSRGSIAFLMNSLSSGSSSRRSVCGLGTLTSSISSSFARSRDSSVSRSFLISDASIRLPLCNLCAALAELFLRSRPQHQHNAERENCSRQRAQHEHRIVAVGDLQRLMERALGKLAEDQANHQA